MYWLYILLLYLFLYIDQNRYPSVVLLITILTSNIYILKYTIQNEILISTSLFFHFLKFMVIFTKFSEKVSNENTLFLIYWLCHCQFFYLTIYTFKIISMIVSGHFTYSNFLKIFWKRCKVQLKPDENINFLRINYINYLFIISIVSLKPHRDTLQ